MSRPGNYDLFLYRGDSYSWTVTLWDDAAKTIPTDLTGVTARAEIAQTPDKPELMDLPCSILGNVITVVLTADLWVGVSISNGVWDLELTYASGDVFTPVRGQVTVTADVTKVGP